MDQFTAERHIFRLIAQHRAPVTTIKWNDSLSDTGITRFYADGSIRVEFSRFLFGLMPDEQCINTILHELAHSMLHYSEGHSEKWSELHKRLGGDGEMYYRAPQNIKSKVAMEVIRRSIE